MSSATSPSMGRMVHYVLHRSSPHHGAHLPALVIDPGAHTMPTMQVFKKHPHDFLDACRPNIKFSGGLDGNSVILHDVDWDGSKNPAPGTWHWPEGTKEWQADIDMIEGTKRLNESLEAQKKADAAKKAAADAAAVASEAARKADEDKKAAAAAKKAVDDAEAAKKKADDAAAQVKKAAEAPAPVPSAPTPPQV